MPAPKGNQFWKLGQQNGRPRKFNTPEELWVMACEYFQWCDENPLISTEFLGKDAEERSVPKMRAYTWSGLEFFCNVASFQDYKNTYKEFSEIITRIEKIIYTQKFEGASAGLLNATIISRDLGLADKNVNETNVTVSEDALRALAASINS